MSKWQDKSDAAINIEVANVINKKTQNFDCYFIFDYCNNPTFSLPIIIENNIIIEPRKDKPALAYVKGDAPHEDKNPLRAAMIVYLEINNA